MSAAHSVYTIHSESEDDHRAEVVSSSSAAISVASSQSGSRIAAESMVMNDMTNAPVAEVHNMADAPVAEVHSVASSPAASNQTVEYVESSAAPAVAQSVASSPVASGGNSEYAASPQPRVESSSSDRLRLLEARQLEAQLAAQQVIREREAAAATLALLEARARVEMESRGSNATPVETTVPNTATTQGGRDHGAREDRRHGDRQNVELPVRDRGVWEYLFPGQVTATPRQVQEPTINVAEVPVSNTPIEPPRSEPNAQTRDRPQSEDGPDDRDREIQQLRARVAEMEVRDQQTRSNGGSSGQANRTSAIFLTPTATVENLIDLSPEVKECSFDDEVKPFNVRAENLGALPEFPIKSDKKSESEWELDLRDLSEREAHLRIAKAVDRNRRRSPSARANAMRGHQGEKEWELDLRGLSEQDAHDRIKQVLNKAERNRDHRPPAPVEMQSASANQLPGHAEIHDHLVGHAHELEGHHHLHAGLRHERDGSRRDHQTTDPGETRRQRMDVHPFMNSTFQQASIQPTGPNGGGGDPESPPGLGRMMFDEDKIRIKEADEIKLPALPDVAKFVAWKQLVRDAIMGASGRGRAVFQWILEVENMDIDANYLSNTAGLDSLDVKLSKAIHMIKKGRVEKRITNIVEEAAIKGDFVTGRRLLRLIYEQYELDKAKGQLYDLRNLNMLVYPGDDQMEAFLDIWDEVVSRLSRHPGDDVLREILFPLMQQSSAMKSALELYKLADPGTPQRSYEFLHRALTLHVDSVREEKNRNATVAALNKYLQTKARVTAPSKEEEPEATTSPTAPAQIKKKATGDCIAWLRGECTRGGACRFSHAGAKGSMPPMSDKEKRELAEKRAKMPCRLFTRGKCKYGQNCQYMHDKSAGSATGACVEDHGGINEDVSEEGTVSDLDEHQFVCMECFDDRDGFEEHEEGHAMVCNDLDPPEWIVDTGTENHLVSRCNVHPDDPGLHKTDRPLRLATANGTITADERVYMKAGEMNEDIDPIVLDQTVNAVSVGRFVMEGGWSFHWENGQPAYFKDQHGKIIQCRTKGYVPVISGRAGEADAMPGINEEELPEGDHDEGPIEVGHGHGDPGDGAADEEGQGHDEPEADAGPDDGEDPEDALTKDERLMREALTVEHSLTHRSKNPFCWVCGMAKMNAKQARRIGPENQTRPSAFGEHVCADHVTGLDDEGSENVNDAEVGLFIIDLYTRWPKFDPMKSKSADNALRALRYFMGKDPLETLYTDCSRELATAAKDIANIHRTSTPYRPQSNGIVERAIRTMQDGARAALLQAGLPPRFWPMACAHQTFATAVSPQPNGDPSPYWLKYGNEFPGWKLPFGSLVHYRPPKPVLKKMHKMAPRTIPGVFIGWHLDPGCEWRGDYLIVPVAVFRDAGRKMYNAHRVKELVSYDPLNFPLQAAYLEDRIKVEPPKIRGDAMWPDQVEPQGEEEEGTGSTTLDRHYRELFGEDPPAEMSHEERYNKVAFELFGSDDEADADRAHEEERPGREEERATGEERDTIFGEIAQPKRIPRARKLVSFPKKSLSSAAAVACTWWTSDPCAARDKAFANVSMEAERESREITPKRRKITPPSDRKLVEYCCSEASRLGHERYVLTGCAVVRLTIKDDMSTKAGLQKALKEVEETPEGTYIHLWGSLPCTGGSPWQRINRKHANARRLIEEHKALNRKLMDNFIVVGRAVLEKGGDVSFEWPSSCSLWDEEQTMSMVEEFSLNKFHIHGCAVDLKDEHGVPIKKPWTIATSSPSLAKRLSGLKCPGRDEHPTHRPCAGKLTKSTEGYTDMLTDILHQAFRDEAVAQRARSAMSAIDTVRGEHDDALKEFDSFMQESGHRQKVGTETMWCAMVTKTIHPNDPLFHHPKAQGAIGEELGHLRDHTTWDEENPEEASDVKKNVPGAHFARIFPIVGIKYFEDAEELQKWKGRIVLAGNRIKLVTGEWAVFSEVGSIPSTMASCRILIAVFALLPDVELLQSDCIRAYVQAPMRGPPTYIRMPRAWWPKSWASRFQDPVCRLIKALYGHPYSGNYWYDKLLAELQKLGFKTIEEWPSVFYLYPDSHSVIAFVVYVDDLVTLGGPHMKHVIAKLRETIQMEDPACLQRYLGCVHHVSRKKAEGEDITEVVFDMRTYFEAAVNQYLELVSEKLLKVTSPYAPRPDDKELEALIAEEGKLKAHAASLVMKLMYGARMAGPHIIVIVNRLSSQITKWSRDSDRKIHRVYSYLKEAHDMVLTGTLSTADRDTAEIIAWPDADHAGDYMHTKSTSGYYLEVRGAEGRTFPIGWGSKRQGCSAQHTGEAETVSLATTLRNELIPAQILLQILLRRPVNGKIMEDNSACVLAIRKGYSPNMRHIQRTQRVSLGMLNEILVHRDDEDKDDLGMDAVDEHCDRRDDEGRLDLEQAPTADHKGDLLTKELDPAQFNRALSMIGMRQWKQE